MLRSGFRAVILMNEEITAIKHGGSDQVDTTSDTLITDFTQVASCAVGNARETRRREKIREELVREHFAREQIDQQQKAFSGPRSLLLKIFRLN